MAKVQISISKLELMKQHEVELLDRWLSDTSFINWAKNANAADSQQWESYLEQHPEHQEIAAMGKFAILNLEAKPIAIEEERSQIALQQLRSRLTKKYPLLTKKTKKVVPFYKRWQMAAAILLLIGLTSVSYLFYAKATTEVFIATQSGEIQQLILTDNSKVTLNANSTLRYYKQHPRQVWLEGEALFEVAKKQATNETFQVLTHDLTVNVLGTIFNVNSRYAQTEVFLEEGKVTLQLDQQDQSVIEMQPGEMVSYSKSQQKILENKQSEASQHTSWKEGILRFKEATLQEILREISAIYGITTTVNSASPNEQLFSGGVPINNMEITIETLKTVYGVEVNLVEGELIIN